MKTDSIPTARNYKTTVTTITFRILKGIGYTLTFCVLSGVIGLQANAYAFQHDQPAGMFDVRDYGAAGDGVTDDSDAFRRTLAEVGEDGARFRIPNGSYLIDGITFPNNVTLEFSGGGQLVVPDSGNVRINGSIDAGIVQIFSGAGSVTGRIDNLQVFPQWFGAQGDGQHNDAPALQRAADLAASSMGNTLFIPDGEYLFLDDIVIRSNVESRGLLVKQIEIDEERTDLYPFYLQRHYPTFNPHIIFAPDHEEQELSAEYFYGVEEGQFELPVYRDVPLANGNGTVDLAEGGTIRFYSSDFFISRNNQKGDQYYDRNDISQIVSGRGDIFPEFAFSYPVPPSPAEWSEEEEYVKGDYVTYGGELFKATWASGEGSLFEDRYLGRVEIGPVPPDPGQSTTGYGFTYDGVEDAMNIWRRVDTRVWYRQKDRPLTVNGLRVELRLENHDGETKRVNAGAVNVTRSNMTFNNMEITVRDPEASVARLLNTRRAVNLEFNNGYFSGATFHGLGYNISNGNVANVRYNNTISTNSRKGLDGSNGKNITVTGGFFNVIDNHYVRNILIRDAVISGLSTYVPGYVTPEADLQGWEFRPRRPFSFAGGNIHIENVTIADGTPGIFSVRGDTPNMYGTVILRDITINRNEGDVSLFSHSINPDFNFFSEVRVPDRLIIEDVRLNDPGRLNLTLGRGFEDETYGLVEVRNSGPVGEVYTSASPLVFTNCSIDNSEFVPEPGALVNFRNCTFSGRNTGLSEENIGAATGNIKIKGTNMSFPANYVNGDLFEE